MFIEMRGTIIMVIRLSLVFNPDLRKFEDFKRENGLVAVGENAAGAHLVCSMCCAGWGDRV